MPDHVYVILTSFPYEEGEFHEVASDLETAKMIAEAEIGPDPQDYNFSVIDDWEHVVVEKDRELWTLSLWALEMEIFKVKVKK